MSTQPTQTEEGSASSAHVGENPLDLLDVVYRGGFPPIWRLWRLKPEDAFVTVSITEQSSPKQQWRWPWQRSE